MSAGASDGPREHPSGVLSPHLLRTEPLLYMAACAPAARGTAHRALGVLLRADVLSKGVSPFSPLGEKPFLQSQTLALGLLVRRLRKRAFALNHPPCISSALTPGLFNTLQLLIKFLSRWISSTLTDCCYSPSELLIPDSKFCESPLNPPADAWVGEQRLLLTRLVFRAPPPLPEPSA